MGEMTLIAPTGLTDRISPDYLELQRQFHQSNSGYGVTGHKYADVIREIVEGLGAKSVLDYGCGKGTLKAALGDIVREYDPCIPGKDSEPERADLVVCTDVLEHIEPHRLDNVLEHIRQLGEHVMLIIATRPANKDLPDGRNAHLIIENADWWKNRLSMMFDIKRWEVQELGLMAIAKPYVLIGDIKGVGVLDYAIRLDYIKQNIKATKKRVKPRKFQHWATPKDAEVPMYGVRLGFDDKGYSKWGIPIPHNRVAIVMCYGPSLADTWNMALIERETIDNADIVSVSGAHDFLIGKGLIPKYHIECDPRPHKGDMMTPHRKVEYLMASCCHPDVVKKITRKNLTIWHMNEGQPSLAILDLEPNQILVPGGGSVGLRSIALLYIMGYRRFLIHGMDCSYKDGSTHAGKHTGKETQKIEVRCSDGRKFITAPVLITYKRYFDELRRAHVGDADTDPTKIEVILRGDGLLQHWLRVCGTANRDDLQNSEAA